MALKAKWPTACIGCGATEEDATLYKEENRWEAEPVAESRAEGKDRKAASRGQSLWATTHVCSDCMGKARKARLVAAAPYLAGSVLMIALGFGSLGDGTSSLPLPLMGVGALLLFPAIHHIEQGSHLFYYNVDLDAEPRTVTFDSDAFRKKFAEANPELDVEVR
ncbi:MAG: hypothetical protein QF415_06570 [Candidatus Undinarchaeales archaeon]|jgi:hypothetical protein|nr:hypothetical protein [Candidatus Undinarchaeales archaeon]MDP7491620.1 hypothetical protein [Candidatus Undinarchaeales archaeon]